MCILLYLHHWMLNTGEIQVSESCTGMSLEGFEVPCPKLECVTLWGTRGNVLLPMKIMIHHSGPWLAEDPPSSTTRGSGWLWLALHI